MAETPASKVMQPPPWLAVSWLPRLLIPFAARLVARQRRKLFAGLSADEIEEKLRPGLAGNPDGLRFLQELRSQLLDTAPVDDATTPAPTGAPSTRARRPTEWHSPSALLLVAANLLPLYGVLAWDWPVFPTVLLFWLENVVIGLLNVLRMLCVDPWDAGRWAAKLLLIPFFCFHYGMFTAGHGAFVIWIFGGEADPVQWLRVLEPTAQAVADFDLALPLTALAGSHLYSFLWNYLWRGEFRRASLSGLMFKPYSRVVMLHLTIVFGGSAAMMLGSPTWALVVLIGLKTALDLKAHLAEHRAA